MRRSIVALALLVGCGPTQDDFDALQAQVDDQADDIEANNDDIAALQTQVAVLDTRVNALEQTLANAQGGDLVALGDAIAEVAAGLGAAEADITVLQAGMTTAQTDITALESDVTGLQSDMTTAQADIDALQAQSGGGSLADDVQDLMGRVDALELHAGNDSWTASGACDCNLSTGSNWASITGSGLIVTPDKAGPLLLLSSSVANSADSYYRLKITQISGGSWSDTSPETRVETGTVNDEVSVFAVVTPPGAGTYQVTIETKGNSINHQYSIAVVQLTEAP